jgi:oligo-1,6-glucosidase
MVSRFGEDGEYRVQSAKLLATFLMTLRGTPTVYQGDEIGMTNIDLGAIENHRDLETLNAYNELVEKGGDTAAFLAAVHPNGRDNARTPVQWKDATHGGFTGGTPWIMANPNYSGINVEAAEANPDSILHYYRKVIRIRKENPVLVYGDVRYCEVGSTAYAYIREMGNEKVLVVLNFSSEETTFAVPDEFAEARYWFGNYPDGSLSGRLRAWEAVVMR